MSKELDLSRENLDDTMSEYEPLLCEPCKVKLRYAAEPLRERLNEGKTPKLRHMNKLLKSICPHCIAAIIRHKQNPYNNSKDLDRAEVFK